jgi:hypothetical protein
MSTVETTLDPKVPMWVQPQPLEWRPDDRRIDGRTSDGKFTKTLLAAADYDATLVMVNRPWQDGDVRPVEAVRLTLKADVLLRISDLAFDAVHRGLVTGPTFNLVLSALVSTSGDWYMHGVTLIESNALRYYRNESGEVLISDESSGLLNEWTPTSFPVEEENPHTPYSNEWYAINQQQRDARNALEQLGMDRWQDLKLGNPMKFLTGLIEAADARKAQKAERDAAIEALKAAQPVSAIDRYRLSKAQEYIDAGFTARGWNVDEDALDEMEYRWVTARLKKVIEMVGKTSLDTGLDHMPYSWRAMSLEEAFVINVDTAVMDIMRHTTRDTGGRRSITPDLLFRFTGTFIEVLSGR